MRCTYEMLEGIQENVQEIPKIEKPLDFDFKAELDEFLNEEQIESILKNNLA